MLAKITSKNQLTLPKAVVETLGGARYLEIVVNDGRIIMSPVRLQSADTLRAKLEELGISEGDVGGAVRWARRRK